MSYKKIQFFGLQCDTNNITGINEYPNIDGINVPEHLDYDIKNRLRKIAGSVDEAYSISDRSAETLKIFTAPEFFFRPYDCNRLADKIDETAIKTIPDARVSQTEALAKLAQETSYSFAKMQHIYGELIAMFRDNVDKRKYNFQNWIFLPGTIFAKIQSTEREPNTFLNVLPVISGGADLGHIYNPVSKKMEQCKATTIQKKLISIIDGAPTDANVYNGQFLPILEKMDELQSNIFSIDGLRIGVEICLDHMCCVDYNGEMTEKGVLLDLCERLGIKKLDAQILIACGMLPIDNSIVSKNGALFRNDGHGGLSLPRMHIYMKNSTINI